MASSKIGSLGNTIQWAKAPHTPTIVPNQTTHSTTTTRSLDSINIQFQNRSRKLLIS
ncbi:uncharacterized protein G2W53_043663 [Senna tora]|uniref:Uncharacterized protein n=1 Tax=Senna tora TaxID=362788 RepID=A0A834SJ54_9FABA|nr:uncharacterized protein G2W53_043663 [Senna tora]